MTFFYDRMLIIGAFYLQKAKYS